MIDFKEFKEKAQSAYDWLKGEYSKISTGRANPQMLDGVKVTIYGGKQPIKSLASIGLEDARTLRISAYAQDSIRPIENALRDSGLPMTVAVDEKGVRAIVPEMTEEKRKDMLKILKKQLEEARVRVRAVRHELDKAIDQGEKGGDFAEDEKFRLKEQLQDHVNEANKKLEDLYDSKETEVLTV